jgi:hypothetical protein
MRHLRHLPAREGEEVRFFLTRERRVLLVVAAAAAVAAVLRVRLCPFALAFGIPCPGCGLSRATGLLLTGHLHAALAMHPLVLVALPFAVVLALHVTSPRGTTALRERVVTALAATLLVAMLAVWLLRFAGAFGGPVPLSDVETEVHHVAVLDDVILALDA